MSLKSISMACSDLSELDGSKDYFADLNQFDLICLDNLDKINKEMEVQTFNLINECKDSSTNLIFACNVSPSELSYLPDLVSRLKQMNYFYINEIGRLNAMRYVLKTLDYDGKKKLKPKKWSKAKKTLQISLNKVQ